MSHRTLLFTALSSALISTLSIATSPLAHAADTPLLSRKVLFGNPELTSGSISPDGKWLGFIAPRDGVLNVWVAPVGAPSQAKPITNDRLRGVRGFSFAYDGKHILYAQDQGGDENFQVFAADLDSGESRALTPKGARAGIAGISAKFPGEILISLNDRNPKFFDLARVALADGKTARLIENERFSGFVTDDDYRLRYASMQTEDGGNQWFVREGDDWKEWNKIPQADALTTSLLGFDASGQTLYLLDSRGRDTGALFALDTKTGQRRLLHEDARADVGGILSHPVTGQAQAVAVNYLRNEWIALDPAVKLDLDALKALAAGGEFGIGARTRDDKTWVVAVTRSDKSSEFFLYDRDTRKARPWFDTRPALPDAQLSKMHGVAIKSRDGLTLPSYFTLPAGSDPDGDGRPDKPVPMVLLVHGGPWARDAYGLNGTHQWFANRGYATLSVNFRGSTGFGKAFVNAGDLQWGRKMHDDLIDGVRWAVQQRIAIPDKVAIMGGSYGGYATLAGLTMTPKEFACGVSIVGPSNLFTLLQTIPPYWGPIRRQFTTRMGDDTTEEGRALLKERSPLTYVDAIERPLLIGQGANDPRVKQAESDQIVQAMQAKKIPVTYVLYPDEGHGFVRPPNRISFNAVAESFLGQCLGGRVEAIGDDFAGSSITVPTGADGVPGVDAALQAMKPASSK
jgi:dipeptidyl aminopeptidase/acylaminoacyl peptidase